MKVLIIGGGAAGMMAAGRAAANALAKNLPAAAANMV